MARKIHIVEESPDREQLRVSLCGRPMLTREEAITALICPDTDLDDYLSLMSRTPLPDWGERNWITVDDFVDGDDSASCWSCRKKLDAALDRFYGEED